MGEQVGGEEGDGVCGVRATGEAEGMEKETRQERATPSTCPIHVPTLTFPSARLQGPWVLVLTLVDLDGSLNTSGSQMTSL